MIVDERMRTYINSLDMGNTPFLEELEQYAIRERVPIIRREMQSFIKMFLEAYFGGGDSHWLLHTSYV